MITILSDEKLCALGQTISDELAQLGHDIKHFPLQNMDIKPCYGCSGCEKKTYRRCVLRDDADLILPYFVRSKTIVAITQITYGSYSFQMKRALDKCSFLTVDMHYGFKDGELVKGLKPSEMQYYVLGVHDHADEAEIQAFEHLVSETLHIARWTGKPIILPSNSLDWKGAIKEMKI